MPKPPVDPGFFDKVNYVIEAWSITCDAPWWFYVEALKPAAFKAFITLITFGWDDVARGYFRPRGLGARRTGKRKGKWRKAVPRFPELGEEIGKRLPGADEMKGRQWSQAGNALWMIDSVIQQGLFWWLVADVTNDFAYDFTSVLYESRWCQWDSRGKFSWATDGDSPIPGGIWLNLTLDQIDYEQPMPSWVIAFGNIGLKGATITGAMRFRPVLGQPPIVSGETRIVDKVTGEIFKSSGVQLTDAAGGVTNLVSTNLPAGRQFLFQGRHFGVWAHYYEGQIIGLEDQ